MIAKDVSSGDGYVSIVDKDYAALSPGSTIGDSDVIYLKQETSGQPLYSQAIKGIGVRKYSGKSYTAPVKKRIEIGYNGSSGSLEVNQGAEYYFVISIYGEPSESVIKKKFHIIADDSATQDSICDDIEAQIDAMPDFAQYFNATTALSSGSDRGVRIEGLDNINFEVSLGENFGATTLGSSQALVISAGDSTSVRALEDYAKGQGKGYLGERRTFSNEFGSAPVYYTVSGETYDLYIIEHDRPQALEGGLERDSNPLVTVVAVPSGPATFPQANFEAILNDWMASTPGAFNPVNL